MLDFSGSIIVSNGPSSILRQGVSNWRFSSRRFQFHQPTCDLFTNGSVVQPIRCFITKIPVSSANSRFVHERRRCSANSRFSSRNFQLNQPIDDLFTNEGVVQLLRSFITNIPVN